MKDAIDALQTLILLLTVAIQLAILLGVVNTLRWIIPLLRELREMARDKPVVQIVQTNTSGAAATPAVPVIVTAETELVDTPKKEQAPALPRYNCRCKVRLPETPIHSVVRENTTFLVYKCGRCGKMMEVNPVDGVAVAVVVSPERKNG